VNWLIGVLRSLTELKVGLADVVDILIVALLIYALLALLRGSRAMQMLWGILAIAGLYLVASTLKLITLSTILGYLLAVLPIAIIVLSSRSSADALGLRSTAWFVPRQDEGRS
jgi:DNA integrity scanning protein DisA with diadenylate cyclase activity